MHRSKVAIDTQTFLTTETASRSIEASSTANSPDIICRGTRDTKKVGEIESPRRRISESFSSPGVPPLSIRSSVQRYSTRKGSSRCKAENPRYKCQVRLPALPLESLLQPFLPPSVCAFLFRHRGWFRLSLPLTWLYLFSHPLSVVTSSPPRNTVPEFSLLVPWFLPNCHPFRVHAYTSLPSVVKSNPRDLSSPPRCSMYLGYSFPCLFTNRLFPFPHLGAHVGETTSTKCREKRGTTDERNRSDLRPASEKAIWANRTPVGRERSSG